MSGAGKAGSTPSTPGAGGGGGDEVRFRGTWNVSVPNASPVQQFVPPSVPGQTAGAWAARWGVGKDQRATVTGGAAGAGAGASADVDAVTEEEEAGAQAAAEAAAAAAAAAEAAAAAAEADRIAEAELEFGRQQEAEAAAALAEAEAAEAVEAAAMAAKAGARAQAEAETSAKAETTAAETEAAAATAAAAAADGDESKPLPAAATPPAAALKVAQPKQQQQQQQQQRPSAEAGSKTASLRRQLAYYSRANAASVERVKKARGLGADGRPRRRGSLGGGGGAAAAAAATAAPSLPHAGDAAGSGGVTVPPIAVGASLAAALLLDGADLAARAGDRFDAACELASKAARAEAPPDADALHAAHLYTEAGTMLLRIVAAAMARDGGDGDAEMKGPVRAKALELLEAAVRCKRAAGLTVGPAPQTPSSASTSTGPLSPGRSPRMARHAPPFSAARPGVKTVEVPVCDSVLLRLRKEKLLGPEVGTGTASAAASSANMGANDASAELLRLRYTAVTEPDPAKFDAAGYRLRALQIGREIRLLVVVTMYNEDAVELRRTLRGVGRNLRVLSNLFGASAWQEVLVVVVVDGRAAADVGALAWLHRALGAFDAEAMAIGSMGLDVAMHLFEVTACLNGAFGAEATHGGYDGLDGSRGGGGLDADDEAYDASQDDYFDGAKVGNGNSGGEGGNGSSADGGDDADAACFAPGRKGGSGRGRLAQLMGGTGLGRDGPWAEDTPPLQLALALKEKNGGKLDSHAWFFEAFAAQTDPKFVVLLDVGTVPAPASIFRLLRPMERDERIAGVCGELAAYRPSLTNFVVASQHFEYKISNVLDRALGSVVGFIDVLPGAFSAYRYEAIKGGGGNGNGNGNGNGSGSASGSGLNVPLPPGAAAETPPRRGHVRGGGGGGGAQVGFASVSESGDWKRAALMAQAAGAARRAGEDGPLGEYFLSISQTKEELGPFRGNMHLAEDRILCFELIARDGAGWLLHYAKGAVAHTDVPETLSGLIKQRRRWLNGAFFATLHGMRNFGRVLRNAEHPLWRKCLISAQLCYTVAALVMSWFLLSNLYLTLVYICDEGVGAKHVGGGMVCAAVESGYVGATVVQLLLALGNKPGDAVAATLNHACCCYYAGTMLLLLVLSALPLASPDFWTPAGAAHAGCDQFLSPHGCQFGEPNGPCYIRLGDINVCTPYGTDGKTCPVIPLGSGTGNVTGPGGGPGGFGNLTAATAACVHACAGSAAYLALSVSGSLGLYLLAAAAHGELCAVASCMVQYLAMLPTLVLRPLATRDYSHFLALYLLTTARLFPPTPR
jgi:cellulose synthase/poly-beta-1,6-N-acetylglucosamine synthase-like glycosyltransferase